MATFSIDGLRQLFFHYLIRLSQLTHKSRVPHPISFQNANQVFLLGAPANAEDQAALLAFQQYLNQKGKTAVLYLYQDDSLPKPPKQAEITVFKKADLNILGLPKRKLVKPFKHHYKPEIGINLTPTELILGHYLVATFGLPFTMAFYTEKYAYIYDFMLNFSHDQNLESNINDFKAYLQCIQKQ